MNLIHCIEIEKECECFVISIGKANAWFIFGLICGIILTVALWFVFFKRGEDFDHHPKHLLPRQRIHAQGSPGHIEIEK